MSELPAIQAPDDDKQLSDVLADETSVWLREALPQLPGEPITLHALRKAAQRGGRFPEPTGKVNGTHIYSLDALCRWKAGRDASRSLQVAGDTGRGAGR